MTRSMLTKNIVLFGQSGAGMSSVVNLMAEEEKAKTSPGSERCTMHWEEYSITFGGCHYKVFDTAGLEEQQLGAQEHLETIVNIRDVITKLNQEGDIHLLLFCVRAGAFTSSIPSNYRLVYERLCKKKVPIVLVLTGLEREKNMEDWWIKYKGTFEKHSVVVDGHACITAANGLDGRCQELYQLSRQLIRTLVREHTHDREETKGQCMSVKNIVLFGQSGVGKSSVVNLIAGEERAKTSPDAVRCTMHWEEYSIDFDGCTYKVFDTVGLKELQLGTKEHLQIIMNAYELIKKLNDEGGIDLLLFCVRASRFTSTIQNNYRLFYEWLCEEKVPIILVLTGLEREQNTEDWWTKNKGTFEKYKIIVDGHACITAVNGLEGRHKELYETSRRLVRRLVTHHTRGKEGTQKGGNRQHGDNRQKGGDGWSKLRELFLGNRSLKKDVVIVLTKRCGIPWEVAIKLAKQVRQLDSNRRSYI
jgi:tRNA U34 5-carboxymethylaminomethyl modifying GTPase MnmE/TrmE